MSFMERARALHQRSDFVRAAFVLAEGVKRDPSCQEAVHWFLQLYVEDIAQPGLEQELVRIVESQTNGEELLDLVTSELRDRQQFARLTYLNRVKKLRGRAQSARRQLGEAARSRHEPDPASARRVDKIEQPAPAPPPSRRGVKAKPLVEPPTASSPATEVPPPERPAARRRRRKSSAETSPQGVLALDPAPRKTREDWGRFGGVASLMGTGEEEPQPEPPARASRAPGSTLPSPAPAADSPPDAFPSDELLPLSSGEDWSFGEPSSPISTPRQEASALRSRRWRHRLGPRLGGAGGPSLVARVTRTVSRVASGRRGLAFLGLVFLLGAAGAGYRTCSGLVDSQLADAEQALQRADGASLQLAVELFSENLADASEDPRRELLDFARALLWSEFGAAQTPPGYDSSEARTPFGVAALVLHQVCAGELAAARAAAEALVAARPDAWVAHWTLGRVALAEGAWTTAESAFSQSHAINGSAVLPVVSLLDLALRAGREGVAEELLGELRALNSEHPMNRLAPVVIAFGLDPMDSRVDALELSLPDPSTAMLSTTSRELLGTIWARRALAQWRLDEAAHIVRELRASPSPSPQAALLDAVVSAANSHLQETIAALERAERASPEGSPARALVNRVAAVLFRDQGRPDLALARLDASAGDGLLRAALLIDAGDENAALRLLGELMERGGTQSGALRLLVDFHLRRGVPDRARLRASGLHDPADQAYAAARLAVYEERWEDARERAQEALRLDPGDADSLLLWVEAMANLGLAEHAIETLDQLAGRSLLNGDHDRARLHAMLISGLAPPESMTQLVRNLSASEPTSMGRLQVLALAWERLGDADQARSLAQRVLAGEPNNRAIHALLGRLLHDAGARDESRRHLRSYLALAPDTEETGWARVLLEE